MDLGATICTPKKPACSLCPWNAACKAFKRGDQESFPRKAPKREGALRHGAAFVVLRDDGRILLRRRPTKGLLGGMSEVPGSEWSADFDARKAQHSIWLRRRDATLPRGDVGLAFELHAAREFFLRESGSFALLSKP
jgi:A/G-specific adenine glycosylase